MKEDSVACNPVEGGSLADVVILVGTGVRPAPVVSDGEEDVRAFSGKAGAEDKKEEGAGESHEGRVGWAVGRGKKLCA